MAASGRRVLVVGGGLSGLSAAYRIRRADPRADLVVAEARERSGGLIGTVSAEGYRVECGPNGFLDTNPSTLELCRDLGIADRLVAASEGARKNRYLLVGGRLRALPGSLGSFLRTGIVGWRTKWRLLTEKYRKRPASAPADETVHEFAVRRVGTEAADLLADAMVTGIHAGDPKLLSAAAAFPRMVGFEKTYGSVMRGFSAAGKQRRRSARERGEQPQPPRMWSFPGGLEELVAALSESLGPQVRRGAGVQSLVRGPGASWTAELTNGDRLAADAVVLTVPAAEQARLLQPISDELARAIGGIEYNRIAVVAAGYRRADVPDRDWDGFGYISPQSNRRDVLGVQWCSSIFKGRAPEGTVLWRALCGGWNRPDIVDWDDARLRTAVEREFREVLGVRGTPVFVHIVRWPRAIPQYFVGHLDRLATIERLVSAIPGVFLGGNCYRGVAMNDCTTDAVRLAEQVASPAIPSN